MQRSPALQCRGAITFHHHDDGQNVFGRAMTVRWSGSPQPIPLEGVTPQGERFQILDPMRLTTDSRIDVYPGETELLDVAVRLDEDEQCYGWNNEAYFFQWRTPGWMLARGRYLVHAVVSSSGQRCSAVVHLVNDVARGDFRLEPTSKNDRARLRY